MTDADDPLPNAPPPDDPLPEPPPPPVAPALPTIPPVPQDDDASSFFGPSLAEFTAEEPSTVLEQLPVEPFLKAIFRSGLATRDTVAAWHEECTTPHNQDDACKLAECFIEKDYLTLFQAQKLLKGKWKGLVLGPYQLREGIGKGGTSRVYLARDTRKNPVRKSSLVALKVLPPKKALDREHVVARFTREMDLAQRVKHPNLTRTYEAGQFNGIYYIAMEYIEGLSLRQFVFEYGKLSVADAADFFNQILQGLAYAHRQELIHRDMKPSNIMVTKEGVVKVLDLGFALTQDEVATANRNVIGGKGYVLGTSDYMAPEQIDDPTTIDHRADLYALGCTLYFCLCERTPFPGGSSREKLRRHIRETATPISELRPDLPPAFVNIVERLMEKRPEKRYANAESVRAALYPFLAKRDSAVPPAGGSSIRLIGGVGEVSESESASENVLPAVPEAPPVIGPNPIDAVGGAIFDFMEQPETVESEPRETVEKVRFLSVGWMLLILIGIAILVAVLWK